MHAVKYLLLAGVAGLTLALFGGVQRYTGSSNKIPVRGDVHCLIVGAYLFLPAVVHVVAICFPVYQDSDFVR